MDDRTSATIIVGLGVFYLGLLVGLQLRWQIARFIAIWMFAMAGISGISQVLRALASSSDDHMLEAAGTVVFVGCCVLTVQLLFAEPVKQFFAPSKPSSNADAADARKLSSADPYAAPRE